MASPPESPRRPSHAAPPWAAYLAVLLALALTPLGALWPLGLVAAGGLVVAGRLRSGPALALAAVAAVGGALHEESGGWGPGEWRRAGLGSLTTVVDERTFDAVGLARLEVSTHNGSITVRTVEGEARVRLTRRGGATVGLERRGDVLAVTTRRPLFAPGGASIELWVPPNLGARLETANGNIEIEGPLGRAGAGENGELRLRTSNGRVEARGAAGPLTVRASNGPVRLLSLRDASLDVRTSNGAVTLERVGLAAGSEGEVRSSNGSISVQGLSAPGGLRIEGDTSNARADIELPGFEVERDGDEFSAEREGPDGAELRLDTSNASIRVSP